MNFSNFNSVLCDSKQALEWAHAHGLIKNAIVRSSSPAVLWDDNPNIRHMEAFWNLDKMK